MIITIINSVLWFCNTVFMFPLNVDRNHPYLIATNNLLDQPGWIIIILYLYPRESQREALIYNDCESNKEHENNRDEQRKVDTSIN